MDDVFLSVKAGNLSKIQLIRDKHYCPRCHERETCAEHREDQDRNFIVLCNNCGTSFHISKYDWNHALRYAENEV